MGIFNMKKEFWMANTIGWLSIYLVNIFFQTDFFRGNYDAFLYSIIICGMSFIVSFFLRWVLLFFNVLERKFIHSIFLSVFLMIVMSLLTIVLYLPILDLIINENSFTFDIILNEWVNLAPVFFCWTLIYMSYIIFMHQQKLTIDKYELSLELKESELNNLRNQLSPHFLFNAINNIRSLVIVDPDKARSSLIEMSDLLRYVLNYQKRKTVTLEDEIDVVKSYIELIKIHLEDNVDFSLSIDVSLYTFLLPPMTIQLLLENAIKHGVIRDKAKVTIEVKQERGCISIKVVNPGKLVLKNGNRIGLKNLEYRIENLFPEKSSFKIYEENNTVTAQIIIQND